MPAAITSNLLQGVGALALAAFNGPIGKGNNWKECLAQQILLSSFKPLVHRISKNLPESYVFQFLFRAAVPTALNICLNPSDNLAENITKSFAYYSLQEFSKNDPYAFLDSESLNGTPS